MNNIIMDEENEKILFNAAKVSVGEILMFGKIVEMQLKIHSMEYLEKNPKIVFDKYK